MDVLFKQLREKYPHEGEGSTERSHIAREKHPHEGEGSRERSRPSGDQILAPQKAESFREKRTQSWIKRQFSKQMNQNYETTAEGDYQIALAAAAFAIKSLEESSTIDPRIRHQEPYVSSTKFKINPDDTSHAPDTRTRSIKFSDESSKTNLNPQDKILQGTADQTGEKPPEKALRLVPAIKKKLSFADTNPIPQPERALPAEEPIGMIPSVKKPLTLNRQFSKEQETPEARLHPLPPKEPPPLPANARHKKTENRIMGDTEAEWERTEMSRIKEKYEKLNANILDWENKKKRKAKRQQDKIEAELDKKGAKAMKHYRHELARIDGIAGGARSKAIENRRHEELKAREKANKIRLTGKLPATCMCC